MSTLYLVNLSFDIFLLQGRISTEIFSTSLFFSQAGPNGATKENWGVNYRALSDLFSISQSRKSSIMYEIAVQMVEIYNEQLRDLLSSDGTQKKYPFTSTCASVKCKTKLLTWQHLELTVLVCDS